MSTILGDVFQKTESVAAGDFFSIQPSVGEETVVHNIIHEAGAELYVFDGTNDILIDSDYERGA